MDAAVKDRVKVDIRDLSFYYDKTKALKNITLPLMDRQVTAFIGPSGCGKSTLLRVLNRIYELYPRQRAEGEVVLDGENILRSDVDLNQLRARVGMVCEEELDDRLGSNLQRLVHCGTASKPFARVRMLYMCTRLLPGACGLDTPREY